MSTKAHSIPGQSIFRRLSRRASTRPMMGASPSFYHRFGLEDPFASDLWRPVEGAEDDADDGGIFSFLSAQGYYRDLRRARFGRSRILHRITEKPKRKLPGERLSAGPASLDLRRSALAMVSPLSGYDDAVMLHFEPTIASEDDTDGLFPGVRSRRREVADDGRISRKRAVTPVERLMEQARRSADPVAQALEEVSLEVRGASRATVRRVLRVVEETPEDAREVVIRKVLRTVRGPMAQITRRVVEQALDDSTNSPVNVAMSRAAGPDVTNKGLRRVLGSSPAITTLEQPAPERAPEPEEAPRRARSRTTSVAPVTRSSAHRETPAAAVVSEVRAQSGTGRAGPPETSTPSVPARRARRAAPTERVARIATRTQADTTISSDRGMRAAGSVASSVPSDRPAQRAHARAVPATIATASRRRLTQSPVSYVQPAADEALSAIPAPPARRRRARRALVPDAPITSDVLASIDVPSVRVAARARLGSPAIEQRGLTVSPIRRVLAPEFSLIRPVLDEVDAPVESTRPSRRRAATVATAPISEPASAITREAPVAASRAARSLPTAVEAPAQRRPHRPTTRVAARAQAAEPAIHSLTLTESPVRRVVRAIAPEQAYLHHTTDEAVVEAASPAPSRRRSAPAPVSVAPTATRRARPQAAPVAAPARRVLRTAALPTTGPVTREVLSAADADADQTVVRRRAVRTPPAWRAAARAEVVPHAESFAAPRITRSPVAHIEAPTADAVRRSRVVAPAMAALEQPELAAADDAVAEAPARRQARTATAPEQPAERRAVAVATPTSPTIRALARLVDEAPDSTTEKVIRRLVRSSTASPDSPVLATADAPEVAERAIERAVRRAEAVADESPRRSARRAPDAVVAQPLQPEAPESTEEAQRPGRRRRSAATTAVASITPLERAVAQVAATQPARRAVARAEDRVDVDSASGRALQRAVEPTVDAGAVRGVLAPVPTAYLARPQAVDVAPESIEQTQPTRRRSRPTARVAARAGSRVGSGALLSAAPTEYLRESSQQAHVPLSSSPLRRRVRRPAPGAVAPRRTRRTLSFQPVFAAALAEPETVAAPTTVAGRRRRVAAADVPETFSHVNTVADRAERASEPRVLRSRQALAPQFAWVEPGIEQTEAAPEAQPGRARRRSRAATAVERTVRTARIQDVMHRVAPAARAAQRDTQTVLTVRASRRTLGDTREVGTLLTEARLQRDDDGVVTRAVVRRAGGRAETVLLQPIDLNNAEDVPPTAWAERRAAVAPSQGNAATPAVRSIRRAFAGSPALESTPVDRVARRAAPPAARRRTRRIIEAAPSEAGRFERRVVRVPELRPLSFAMPFTDAGEEEGDTEFTTRPSRAVAGERLRTLASPDSPEATPAVGPTRRRRRPAAAPTRRARALGRDAFAPLAAQWDDDVVGEPIHGPAATARRRAEQADERMEPRVNVSRPMLTALARAGTPEEIVRVILERSGSLRNAATDLPGPAARLVERIVQMQADGQLESVADRSVAREASAPMHTVRTNTVLQPVSTTTIRSPLPRSTASSSQGVGASQTMKLANKLMKLIHLAENERRRGDAQREVRMAEDSAEARAEGSASGPDDSGVGESLNIKQLQRDVLTFVMRELELSRSRREDPDGGNIWW